jgi:tripartite-type tricarboxylate transporter receptor subunit TctC
MAVMPLTVKNMPLDPFKDIRPICGMGKAAVTIVVAANSPYKTVREMTDAARAADRPLNAGNYSAGYQLVNTWVSTVTGAKVTHVNYKGGAQMLVDVMGGQLDFASIDATGPVALAKDGKVRILAITSDVREPSLPQVPTMKESGYADFETWTWTSFYVRAETPDPVVNRLAELMQQVLDTDEAKAYAKSRPGSRLNAGPEEMRRFHRSEFERFKKVAEAAGVKPE